MNLPQVYPHSPSWTLLHPPSPTLPLGRPSVWFIFMPKVKSNWNEEYSTSYWLLFLTWLTFYVCSRDWLSCKSKLFQNRRIFLHNPGQYFLLPREESQLFSTTPYFQERLVTSPLQMGTEDSTVAFSGVKLAWYYLLDKWKLYHKDLSKWERE